VWLCALLAVFPGASFSEGVTPARIIQSPSGPIIEFENYQAALGNETQMPTSGWKTTTPALERFVPTKANKQAGKTVLWGRMTFDRSQIGRMPMAIFSIGNRDQLKIVVNGRELFRNYVSTSDLVQSWYWPFFVSIPADALKEGQNEIIFQTSGWQSLAVGRTFVGPQDVLQKKYDAQLFARINGPIVANAMMALLGLCAILLWTVRRREIELLFLALTAFFWLARNHHFYTTTLPFHPLAFQAVTHFSLYFAAAASASFSFSFLRIAHYKAIIAIMFGVGIVASLLHFVMPMDPLVIMLLTFFVAIATGVIGAKGLRQTHSFDNFMVSFVISSIVLLSTHDFGRHLDFWDGVGFYFQPYIGFFFTSAFLISFGRRAQRAFVDVNSANETLGERIAQVRQDLETSETNRRVLEIDRAIAKERVRLMQEMHDGIGSNLVTALAIAENQNQPEATVRLLRRALSDLKITVDSLEPFEGDVVVLIGNLRHRMANDLKEAGLRCVWEVEDCPTISWLDAASALHAVRIIQEAIGNVIEHAEADRITIGCHPRARQNVEGVAIFVSDNGRGFEPAMAPSGKGITNMKSRAKAIRASLDCTSSPENGTRLTLWLPLRT
jgi:signal transduction histidine kinase